MKMGCDIKLDKVVIWGSKEYVFIAIFLRATTDMFKYNFVQIIFIVTWSCDCVLKIIIIHYLKDTTDWKLLL